MHDPKGPYANNNKTFYRILILLFQNAVKIDNIFIYYIICFKLNFKLKAPILIFLVVSDRKFGFGFGQFRPRNLVSALVSVSAKKWPKLSAAPKLECS